jgi:hypothetical protein
MDRTLKVVPEPQEDMSRCDLWLDTLMDFHRGRAWIGYSFFVEAPLNRKNPATFAQTRSIRRYEKGAVL